MSKRPTPKKRRAPSASSSQRKTYNNKVRKKLQGKVDFMKRTENNPRFKALIQEKAQRASEKIVRVKA